MKTATEGTWTILAAPGEIDAARSFVARHGASFSESGARRIRPKLRDDRGGASGRGGLFEARDGEGRLVVVKALHRGGLPSRLGRSTYGRARLVAEMAIQEEASRRGVPTSRLVFGAVSAPPGKRAIAFLATMKLENTLSLAECLGGQTRDREERRARHQALISAGRAVRRAHDLGLDHADLNIGNILIRVGDQSAATLGAWVIDLGISKLGPSLTPGQRAGNLVRLLRSAEKHLGSDPGRGRSRDAAAFLHGYCSGGDVGGEGNNTGRDFRRALRRAIRRRLPVIALHRLGWILSGATSRRRSQPRRPR